MAIKRIVPRKRAQGRAVGRGNKKSAAKREASGLSRRLLNVDPGTMNPFQHGEVFVTDDGAPPSKIHDTPEQPLRHPPSSRLYVSRPQKGRMISLREHGILYNERAHHSCIV